MFRLQAEEDEEGNDLVFQITLRYDLDKIRPKHKSLDVQFVRGTGQQVWSLTQFYNVIFLQLRSSVKKVCFLQTDKSRFASVV